MVKDVLLDGKYGILSLRRRTKGIIIVNKLEQKFCNESTGERLISRRGQSR